MMKVRLYKGPFSGQVREAPSVSNELVFIGAKRMTRKARYEWMIENYTPVVGMKPLPRIQARYKVAVDPVTRQPLRHPDGSVFMEWTGERREL